MICIRITVTPDTNPSIVGEAFASYPGVSWRHAANDRVFLDLDSSGTSLDELTDAIEADPRVSSYWVGDVIAA